MSALRRRRAAPAGRGTAGAGLAEPAAAAPGVVARRGRGLKFRAQRNLEPKNLEPRRGRGSNLAAELGRRFQVTSQGKLFWG